MRRLACLLAVAAAGLPGPAGAQGAQPPPPQAVVAVIDTGVNPYASAFRDDSPLAFQHPSTYLPGYPPDAPALHLTLDAPSFQAALAADAAVWASVRPGVLYWIPGTKIVGAISRFAGGVSCPTPPPPGGCVEHRILDDHGHGTMTASRAAAVAHSLGREARLVIVEGIGPSSVEWASEQEWIDVQTNSWANLVPPPAGALGPSSVGGSFLQAARRHLVFAASGNGLGFTYGFAPMPTYLVSTGAPGVILVGAHDNGRMTLWSESPPSVVADGYGGWTALRDSIDFFGPHPIACCTSAASPYAAGGAAAIIIEARRILGDTRTGVHGGIVAQGTPVGSGPLADGKLTLDELRRLVVATAEPLPTEGADDGLLHWLGEPRPPDHLDSGPGSNPFCPGCWTTPLRWDTLPPGTPVFPAVGYGAINERSVALAAAVLRGQLPLPSRDAEDAFFAADAAARGALFAPGNG